jgi:hypothetical protein
VTGVTDSANISRAAAANADVLLGPGNWYLNGVTITANGLRLRGSGEGTIINVPAAGTGITLNNPSQFTLRDMSFSLGASSLGIQVNGAVDSTFQDLYATGANAAGFVKVNGDDATEQHWTDVVCRNVGGIPFDYERTNGNDTGGLYFDRFRIVSPPSGASYGFKFNATGAGVPNVNVLMTQCISDNMPGTSVLFNNVASVLLTNCWFTCATTAASGTACLHITGGNTYVLDGCRTVQACSSGAAYNVLLDGAVQDVLIEDHQFYGVANIALGLAAVGANFVLGPTYYSNCTTLTDTNTALSNCNVVVGPRVIYTNGAGGAGSTIGIVDSNAPSVVKFIRNSAGSLQVLNNAFSASILNLSDAGILAINGTDTAQGITTGGCSFANGTAAQIAEVTTDAMVYLVCTTTGTAFSLAIGPTSGVAYTLLNNVPAIAGTLYTVRLPAGWYLKWSGTAVGLAQQAYVSC